MELGAAGAGSVSDPAAVAGYDGLADWQAEPKSELDASAFGGETAFKHVSLEIIRDSGAVVFHLGPREAGFARHRADAQDAAAFHGLGGIHDQVRPHLFDLRGDTTDGGRGSVFLVDFDPAQTVAD